MKKFSLTMLFVLLAFNAYCGEVTFKQKAELYIVNGKVIKSYPHAYVTLDIQRDKVFYKTINDWKRKTISYPGGVFQIVSQGNTMMTPPEPVWVINIKEFFGITKTLKTEHVIRAFYSGGESVNFLIIGESFLLEVKNSVFFGNATNYLYYERVQSE